MPKIVSDHEKEIIRTNLLDKGEKLIHKKGIKSTTVDDITREANIGKGSFYAYFNSKEELFWEIIKRSEEATTNKMVDILSEKGNKKEKIIRFFTEEYNEPDDLRSYLSFSDYEYLTRKLSPEMLKDEGKRIDNLFTTTLSLCNVNEAGRDMAVVVHLTNLLTFIYTLDTPQSKQSKETTLKIIINAIADYIIDGEVKETGGKHE